MISNEVMTAINDVLACEDPLEAMAMYLDKYSLLKECRFILFSNELGTDIPFFLKYQKIDNFHIHSLTTATKMLVIDFDTCNLA